MKHHESCLGELPFPRKQIINVESCSNNLSTAILYNINSKESHLYYQGYKLPFIKENWQGGSDFQYELNYSGDRLAICRRVLQEDHKIVIDIYQPGSDIPIEYYYSSWDTLYRMAWIDDKQLAYYGWIDGEDHEIDTEFHINGEPAPKDFSFEIYWGGSVYFKWADGRIVSKERNGEETISQGEPGVGIADDFNSCWQPGLPDGRQVEERPGIECFATHRDGVGIRESRVAYKNYKGPKLEGLVESGTVGVVIDEQKSQLGYVQLYTKPWFRPFDKLFDIGDLSHSIFSWPLFLLFFLPSLLISALFAVHGQQVIQTFMKEDEHHFWTPCNSIQELFYSGNRLVALQINRFSQQVIINDRPGPKFNDIWNLKGYKDGTLTYLGVRGKEMFRVEVK